MTNEERIYKLCEYVIDLMDTLPCYDINLDWIKDEIISIRADIDNS